jgi:hypothetical protein
VTEEVEPQKTLAGARSCYKQALFRAWYQARVNALAGISDTVRGSARFAEWERRQTIKERLCLPKGLGQKLDRALAARRQAAKAAQRAAAATRQAVAALVEQGGMSYRDAGDLLGFTRVRAYQLFRGTP